MRTAFGIVTSVALWTAGSNPKVATVAGRTWSVAAGFAARSVRAAPSTTVAPVSPTASGLTSATPTEARLGTLPPPGARPCGNRNAAAAVPPVIAIPLAVPRVALVIRGAPFRRSHVVP